ncbi:unnamed protein product [Cunninghamella echinulata]
MLLVFELPNWYQWIQLPYWFTERAPLWYYFIQPNNNYQSLEFSIERVMVQWTDDSHKNNEKTKNKYGFFLQGWEDNQLQKLKACDYFFPINSNSIPQPAVTENGFEEEINYYYYYSQIITLPTTISFMHLNHLLLDFKEWNRTSTSQLDILKFDERIIESIYEACPILGSLHLRGFNMNLSNQYRDLMKLSSSTIKPCLTLKQLKIEFHFLFHPECFDYLAIKFPNISTLSFSLDVCFTKDEEIKHKFNLAYYKMLSTFQHLSTLSTKSFFWGSCPYYEGGEYSARIDNKLLYWLSNKPHPLKSLTYHHDWIQLIENDSEIKNNENKDQLSVLKQKYSFMDHLQELKLINERNINKAFTNLSFMFKKGVYYNQLTTLNIIFKGEHPNIIFKGEHPKEVINFYSWLDLFPNLKKLMIEEVITMVYKGMDKRNLRIELQRQGQQQNKIYPLEELNITGAELLLVNGLTDIGHACPLLKKLRLIDVLVLDGYHTRNDNVDVIIMDTPHLKLDEFAIVNMYTTTNKDIPKNIKRSFELITTELYNRNSNKDQPFSVCLPSLYKKNHSQKYPRIRRRAFGIYDKDKTYPSIQVILNCEYVDSIYCINCQKQLAYIQFNSFFFFFFFYQTLNFHHKNNNTVSLNFQILICNLVHHITLDDCFEKGSLKKADFKCLRDSCFNISYINSQQ